MKRLFILLAFVLAASAIRAQSDMTAEDLMSGDSRSLYEVLGVSQNTVVTYDFLKNIINNNYPSKGEADLDNLDEIRKGVVAYSVLSDAELQYKYDAAGLKAISDKVSVPNMSIPMYEGEPWDAIFHSKCLLQVKFPKKEWTAKHWGVVKLSYVLGADKSIRDVKIEKSSGYAALDKAALKAFNKVAKKGAKHLQPAISLTNGTPVDTRMEFGIYFNKRNIGLTGSPEHVAYPRGWEYVSGKYDYTAYQRAVNNYYLDGTLPPRMGPNSRVTHSMYGGDYGRTAPYQDSRGYSVNVDKTVQGPAKAGK